MKLIVPKKSILFFALGFNLLSTISIMLFLCVGGFIIGMPISNFYFPIALILSGALTFFMLKIKGIENLFETCLLLLFSLSFLYTASFILAANFYDVSWDGQTYHQESVIQLRNGWNPFCEKPAKNLSSVWIMHYPKGAEIPQAALFAFFKRVEIAKATNIILIVSSFFLFVSVLLEFKIISELKLLLVGCVAAFNPIAVCQALTFYIDGQVASLILCLLSLSFLLFQGLDKYRLLLFFFCISLLLNLKFTAFGLVGIVVIGLLIVLYRNNRKADTKKIFVVAGVSSFVAVVMVGFNPYVTNVINNGNPFYPLAGKGKMDIFSYNCPQQLLNKNRIEKFFISTYAKTEDISGSDYPQLKIPFFFEKDELKVNYHTRIAGFGFWFSGIFSIASILSIFLFLFYFRAHRYQLELLSLVFIMFALSVFMISEPWWARYIPQVWFFPIAMILFAEETKNRRIQFLSTILLVIILVNVIEVCSYTALFNRARTKEVKAQISELKKTNHKPIHVDFGLFLSNRIRLEENNIPYVMEAFDLNDTAVSLIASSQAKFKQ
jgi:hypothetical protein